MTTDQHIRYFKVLAFICLLLSFLLPPTLANYVPLLWAILGVVLNYFWGWINYLRLSRFLIKNHKADLKQQKIEFHESAVANTIAFFAIFYDRDKLEKINPSIANPMKRIRVSIRLALVGFLFMIIFALIPIVLVNHSMP